MSEDWNVLGYLRPYSRMLYWFVCIRCKKRFLAEEHLLYCQDCVVTPDEPA